MVGWIRGRIFGFAVGTALCTQGWKGERQGSQHSRLSNAKLMEYILKIELMKQMLAHWQIWKVYKTRIKHGINYRIKHSINYSIN